MNEVKDLVERGATLKLDDKSAIWYKYNNGSVKDTDYSLTLIDNFDISGLGIGTNRKPSSIPERKRITEYLLDNAERAELNPERLLYYALESDCEWLYELLKNHGVSLSEELKRRCGGRLVNYVIALETIDHFRFMLREVGFEYINKYMDSKTDLLEYFIDYDAADLLSAVEPYGWFKQPGRLQELIAYAADNHNIQCAAWLLEYSNRARK